MGKKHRDGRRLEKLLARRFGWKETELGEWKKTTTKAEARRRFLRSDVPREAILNQLYQASTRALQELEDADFLQRLATMIKALSDGVEPSPEPR